MNRDGQLEQIRNACRHLDAENHEDGAGGDQCQRVSELPSTRRAAPPGSLLRSSLTNVDTAARWSGLQRVAHPEQRSEAGARNQFKNGHECGPFIVSCAQSLIDESNRLCRRACRCLRMATGVAYLPQRAQLVIVVDGLRPDYIDAIRMPRLARLAAARHRVQRPPFSASHRHPTERSPSFVTGAYPENHGLLGNTVFVPSVDPRRGLDTGRRENLERIAGAEGRLLTAPTLGEILKGAGQTMMALGTGTTGAGVRAERPGCERRNYSSGLRARRSNCSNRLLLDLDLRRRQERQTAPSTAASSMLYLQLVLDTYRPNLTWIWLNDPDATAHAQRHRRRRDRRVADASSTPRSAAIEDSLRASGRLDRTNI